MGLTGDMGLLLMSAILPIQNVRHHTYPAWSGLIHSLLHFIRVYFSSPSAPIEGITSTDTVQSFVSISTFFAVRPLMVERRCLSTLSLRWDLNPGPPN